MVRLISIAILGIAAASSLTGCSCCNMSKTVKEENPMPKRSIEQVLNERADEWMAIPGIVGTAIGTFEGKPCIKIFTCSKPQGLQTKIPSTIENYPVIIEETGTFRALDQE